MSHKVTQPNLEDYSYNLMCQIVVFRKGYQEQADRGQQHNDYMVALVPRNDWGQYVQFLNAWMPATNKEDDYHEVAMQIGSPIHSPCRGAVMRANKDVRAPHIFIMSTGVEEMLKTVYKQKPKTQIQLTVLPQDSEDEADDAPSINRTAR